MELAEFIIAAKAATYVGSGEGAISSRPGAHDLVFEHGPWSYRDSYFGGSDFIGQEVVWRNGAPVWAMNYHGWILRGDLLSASEGGAIIRAALSDLYREGRFLGGHVFIIGRHRYVDENRGNFERFDGTEAIFVEDEPAYRLLYHGGLIRR